MISRTSAACRRTFPVPLGLPPLFFIGWAGRAILTSPPKKRPLRNGPFNEYYTGVRFRLSSAPAPVASPFPSILLPPCLRPAGWIEVHRPQLYHLPTPTRTRNPCNENVRVTLPRHASVRFSLFRDASVRSCNASVRTTLLCCSDSANRAVRIVIWRCTSTTWACLHILECRTRTFACQAPYPNLAAYGNTNPIAARIPPPASQGRL